jgi:hypothetical protein
MKYLCLAYYDETKFDSLTEAELAEIGRRCQPYDGELAKSGHLLLSGSLGRPRETTTLRPGQGKAAITDGPFVETKEQIGGFFLIEARDLNEALRVASKHPAAHMNEHLGWALEVRPLGVCEAHEALEAEGAGRAAEG